MTRKDSIKIRKRELSNGNQSIYLDVYRNGKREYEFLKLYLVPETNKVNKEQNRNTIQLVEAIKSKRTVELHNREFGFNDNFKLNTNFIEYYKSMCTINSDGDTIEKWDNWASSLRHLERYCNPKTTLRDVTPEFVRGFRDYLDKKAVVRNKPELLITSNTDKVLSQNSKRSYFNKFRACINKAFNERLIPHNPLLGVPGFRNGEAIRIYLTLDEVKRMITTECPYPALKRAFLFSCLTGLRKSDIQKMTWGEVHQEDKFTRIIFRQQKTGGQEYLDINPQAILYLGKQGRPEDLVFAGFTYSAHSTIALRMWAVNAGVGKNITFHSGRHTFAVMMIELGAEIYTVSKLLGHKDLKTTQVYAKVLDKKKQEAVSLIPDIFND